MAGISREMSAVVARAIETDPKLRLPSAEEFKQELDRIADLIAKTRKEGSR